MVCGTVPWVNGISLKFMYNASGPGESLLSCIRFLGSCLSPEKDAGYISRLFSISCNLGEYCFIN